MIGDVKPKSQEAKRLDAKETGGGGVGEDIGNHSERFNDYNNNTVSGQQGYNHLEGSSNTIVYAYNMSVGGNGNTITAGYCGAEYGNGNTKTNCNSTLSCGRNNTMGNADSCLVVGESNNVTGDGNVVGGFDNTVPNHYNLVVGAYNNANGSNSNIVAGESNKIYGTRSLVVGYQHGDNNTPISPYDSIVCGYGHKGGITYGIVCGMHADLSNGTGNRIVVGNGSGSTASNCFRVDSQGRVYAAEYNTSGADYAEYFEWADGNPKNEDRRGMLVTFGGAKQKTYIHDDMYNEDIEILQSDKIVFANGDEILGAVSCRPSVIGNACEEHWHGKYKTDVYGDYILDEDGKPRLSDDYDSEREYIPRSQRPEWAAVGMVGRLIIRDNGKCQPGGYVTARQGVGYPTLSETRTRCLRRIDDNHIEILIR